MSLVNIAYAADAAPKSSGFAELGMIAAFVLIFYFLILRPQNKRQKEHKQMVSAIKKGDEVVTNGGILGKILKISDDFIKVAISDGVEILLQKNAIASVLPKGTMKAIQ